MIFRRDQYSSLWITLTSDESLGILDSSYIEDDTRLDGYLTLYHVASGVCAHDGFIGHPNYGLVQRVER